MNTLAPRLSLVLVLLAFALPPTAHAQDGTFLVFFDEAELPREPMDSEELARRLAEAIEVGYEGERPVEGVLAGGVIRDGEFLEWVRFSRPFRVESGERVAVTDPENMARLFPDGYFFPDDYFFSGDTFFPDGYFLPEEVREATARHEGLALFLVAVPTPIYMDAAPSREDMRERVASRPMVVLFEEGR